MRLGRLAQNRRSSRQPLGYITVTLQEILATCGFILYCERWCYICEVLLASSLPVKIPNRGRYKVGNRLIHGAPEIRPSDEPCSQPSHKPRGLPRGFIFCSRRWRTSSAEFTIIPLPRTFVNRQIEQNFQLKFSQNCAIFCLHCGGGCGIIITSRGKR